MKTIFFILSYTWFLTFVNLGNALSDWCHKKDSDSINGDILKNIYPSNLEEKYLLWSSKASQLTFKECVSKCCDEAKSDSSCEPLVKDEDDEDKEETFWYTVREVEEQKSQIKFVYSTMSISNNNKEPTTSSLMKSLTTMKLQQANHDSIIKNNDEHNNNELNNTHNKDYNKHNNKSMHNISTNMSTMNNINCSLTCSYHGVCEFSGVGDDSSIMMLCLCDVPYTHNPFTSHYNCDWNMVNVCFIIIITTIIVVVIITYFVCKLCRRRNRESNEYEAFKRYRRKNRNKASFYGKYFDSSSENAFSDEEDEDEYLVMSRLKEMESSKRVLLGGKNNFKSKNVSKFAFKDKNFNKSVDKNEKNNLHSGSDNDYNIMISDHSRRNRSVDKNNKFGTKVAFDKRHQFSLVGAGVKSDYNPKVFS